MDTKIITKRDKLDKQLRTLNERQSLADCFVTIRVNSAQLLKLKHLSQAENRSISNYIKTKLF